MKTFSESELEALINRSLDDTAYPYITKSLIAAGGSYDWKNITSSIEKWQRSKTLTIIKYPEHAENDEICLKMITYINRKSAIPGFLNYE